MWNSLCSDRQYLIPPSSCSGERLGDLGPGGGGDRARRAGGSWSRPETGRSTGDGLGRQRARAGPRRQPRCCTTGRRLTRRSSIPTTTTSAAPRRRCCRAPGLALQGGKAGVLDLLDLDRLDGTTGGPGRGRAAELQQLHRPAQAQVFTTPAVTTIGGRPYVFVGRRLRNRGVRAQRRASPIGWPGATGTPGTSPVIAGGLLYVYDQGDGSLVVRLPVTGQAVDLAAGRDRSLEQPDRRRRADHPAGGQLHDSFLGRRARHLAPAGAIGASRRSQADGGVRRWAGMAGVLRRPAR